MLWVDYYKPADPPTPGPADIRRMAVDAVRDGLPISLVARLFHLDLLELSALAELALGPRWSGRRRDEAEGDAAGGEAGDGSC